MVHHQLAHLRRLLRVELARALGAAALLRLQRIHAARKIGAMPRAGHIAMHAEGLGGLHVRHAAGHRLNHARADGLLRCRTEISRIVCHTSSMAYFFLSSKLGHPIK